MRQSDKKILRSSMNSALHVGITALYFKFVFKLVYYKIIMIDNNNNDEVCVS